MKSRPEILPLHCCVYPLLCRQHVNFEKQKRGRSIKQKNEWDHCTRLLAALWLQVLDPSADFEQSIGALDIKEVQHHCFYGYYFC